MDMLDTGVLVCHLARIIQAKAKDVVVQYDDGSISISQPEGHFSTIYDEELRFQQFCNIYNGSSSPDPASTISVKLKQAQQYLHQLLRGANSRETLLAAAKVAIDFDRLE